MNATTEPLVIAVTAQDRRALRNADKIIWRLYNGQATLEATKDGHRTADGFEQKHTVYCAATIAVHDAPTGDISEYSGFHSDYWRPALRTLLLDLIPVGATLTLAWTAGNNNENNRNIGWVRDELYVVIDNGKRKRTFLVAVQVGPDNSARMIKRQR